MTEIRAVYYDGRAAQGREVTLSFDTAGNLEIAGAGRAGKSLRYSAGELRFSPRIGDTPRSIVLPDGGKVETDANDAVDALLTGRSGQTHARLLHRLESRWPYILLLFLLTVGTVWAGLKFVVPDLARRAAFAMPVSADQALGTGTLQTLDKALLTPSKLETERQAALRAHFDEIVRGLDGRYRFRLELRASQVLGPNALALPDGTIVVTDELVRLAQREEELLSVLAHEIGHVLHRHALRNVLQSSAVALLIAFAMGDVVSLTSLAAALPTMLVEAKFSRDFEHEADLYTLEFLRSRNISPRYAADMLGRLAEHERGKDRGFSYLSSHPGIEERIKLFNGER